MSDLISRQAAIDAIHRDANPFLEYAATQIEALPSVQPYTNEEIQKMQEAEQAEIDKAFELGRASAEAEIIRCKDCKHFELNKQVSMCLRRTSDADKNKD